MLQLVTTLVLIGSLLLLGCASSKPAGQRLHEDVGCVTALAAQGKALSSNASVDTVLASIQEKSDDPVVMENCTGFLQNLGADGQAVLAKIKARHAAPPAPAAPAAAPK